MFFFIKRNSENIKFNQDKKTSREILHDTIKKNCEPEWEIRLTIAALEH